jgi:hypothetical protein
MPQAAKQIRPRGRQQMIAGQADGRPDGRPRFERCLVSVLKSVLGELEAVRIPPFFPQLLQLGYPAYFAAILGIWKVLGAIALLAPRYPLVKEWAYAGLFIDYTAALASRLVVGEGTASNLSEPILSIALLASSWALRHSSRRIAAQTTSPRP